MNTKHTLRYAEEPKLDDLFVGKSFNEWMLQAKSEALPKRLFGSLWLEGEIAVMTANGGLGKSLLAVQIAESIGSGKAFGPFEMTAKPQKVLYLNLKLSSKQFAVRYSAEADETNDGKLKNRYKFSDNLKRFDIDIHKKLPEAYRSFDEILAPLVERLVKKYRSKVVVIDNITILQRSVYGYRETYTMMRALHRLKTQLGVSILVLARTSKYGSVRASEAGSCSALFSRFADSVFVLEQSRLDPSMRYVKQLMVHSSERVYDESHVVSLTLKRIGGNFLGFEHCGFSAESEHNQPLRENVLWPKIDNVKMLSDEGKSVRAIAAELDIPKSNVQRYLQMWNEQIGAAMKRETAAREPYDQTKDKYYFPGREEYDEAGRDPRFKNLGDSPQDQLLNRESYIIQAACARAWKVWKKTGTAPKLIEDKEYAEFMGLVPESSVETADAQNGASALQHDDPKPTRSNDRRGWPTVNEKGAPIDLSSLPEGVRHSLNGYGQDIWIETEDEYTGKPAVWYSFDSKAQLQKHVRDCNGISITLIDKPDGPLNGMIWVDNDESDLEEPSE